MKYSLEKYHGRNSRHECPSCHDPHSFTYYIDENGNMLDPRVGRCNHESSCGYHYSPKDYFHDNPDSKLRRNVVISNNQKGPSKPKNKQTRIQFLPSHFVNDYYSQESNFVKFLFKIFK